MQSFDLSIILAEAQGRPELAAALASIECACTGIPAEVLVVRPLGRPALPRSTTLTLRELVVEEHTLVPERWGVGVRAAQAPIFACLTTEFTVHPDWARTLLVVLANGTVGAAGAIALAPRSGITAGAVYLLRFSAFLPRGGAGPRVTENIPGDTAAYRRDAVVAFPDLLAQGFWELEFHRRFVAQGDRLLAVGEALATFDSDRELRAALLLRVRHGYQFGITRVMRHRHNPWRLLLFAPLVPAVLLARIFRRTAKAPQSWWLAIRSLPVLAILSLGWAYGEAAGAWSVRDRR